MSQEEGEQALSSFGDVRIVPLRGFNDFIGDRTRYEVSLFIISFIN